MQASTQWMERHQVALYMAGLGAGALVGLAWPAVSGPAGAAIHPVLALLLYATFLGIPFGRIRDAFRDGRFLAAVLLLNFLAVPLIAWALSLLVAHDRALFVGVLFVLLTPCIDYVIVFAGLARGDAGRLLAVSPLLMLGQMVALPLLLWLFAGSDVVASIEIAPFVDAFVWIIAVPLAAAALTQLVSARSRAVRRAETAAASAMVPLMVATLAAVVASQIAGVRAELDALLAVVPIFAVFAAVMVPVGMATGRTLRLDVAGRRAIVFSGATRNSLVVLPLALALPAEFALAPLVVVTQTLVELIAMVLFVRLVPRLVPDPVG